MLGLGLVRVPRRTGPAGYDRGGCSPLRPIYSGGWLGWVPGCGRVARSRSRFRRLRFRASVAVNDEEAFHLIRRDSCCPPTDDAGERYPPESTGKTPPAPHVSPTGRAPGSLGGTFCAPCAKNVPPNGPGGPGRGALHNTVIFRVHAPKKSRVATVAPGSRADRSRGLR